MTQLIDGTIIAKEIKEEAKQHMMRLREKGKTATLAFIRVGDDQASAVYMKSQKKACEYVGLCSQDYCLPDTTTETELLQLIEQLNKDPKINGILVETPVPPHINKRTIVSSIASNKDVDGFHPFNVGLLAIGESGFLPCTPSGIMQLLRRSGIVIAGTNCVIVGRSNNVGIPMALLMLRENATVTIAHSKTQNLEEICQTADILIVAVGKKKFIGANHVKKGAVVVDVGMHREENGNLCGDVDFEAVKDRVLAITPVPGGVGPMTIAMLMSSCVNSIEE
ncbi:MAG: tetrahydrofolate dehydrogenase/cyclohydrolase catalytic domain-containing protein [Lachnospiraceae bacterium]